MKRSRQLVDNSNDGEPNPKRKCVKSSKTVIDLTKASDDIPEINVECNEPIKVYYYIFDLNNNLKPNKVSKLFCFENSDDIIVSSSESSDYCYIPETYEDFDYMDDGQGGELDKTLSYSSSDEDYTYGVDWSFDYLNDD